MALLPSLMVLLAAMVLSGLHGARAWGIGDRGARARWLCIDTVVLSIRYIGGRPRGVSKRLGTKVGRPLAGRP